MSQADVLGALSVLYRERTRLLILGFTGRTGSGCTTASRLITYSKNQISLPKPQPTPAHPEERKYRIIHRFFDGNWIPFRRLSITGVLLSYIVEGSNADLRAFVEQHFKKVGQEDIGPLLESVRLFREAHEQAIRAAAKTYATLTDAELEAIVGFYFQSIEPLLDTFRSRLKVHYIPFFQVVGDNLRRSGSPFLREVDPKNIYAVAARVDYIIRVAALLDERRGQLTRLALDALRNPFEAIYFKDRYASFYLVAVNADDDDREARLSAAFSREDIKRFDEKEYPRTRLAKASTYEAYISQDIQGCIEKADIHIHNPGRPQAGEERTFAELALALVRYTCLALHPGLVTPTRTERCMQIAYSAKVNSGCISRQVGAVVTNVDGAVMAVGWNDVPYKQVPCLLRDVNDLRSGDDEAAFSQYEMRDKDFRDFLKKRFPISASQPLGGRSCPFCFRDAVNEKDKNKDRSMTRSLHAEENAFLQVAKTGGAALSGGHLYSTASPCELCSKKAYQLGIQDIWYVDPYPGISRRQVLESGPTDRRPRLHLFSGAIGDAYHKLYEQVMPYKDEINAFLTSSDAQPTLIKEK